MDNFYQLNLNPTEVITFWYLDEWRQNKIEEKKKQNKDMDLKRIEFEEWLEKNK